MAAVAMCAISVVQASVYVCFDTEGADGVIGPKSESAIRAYQRQNGLPETGQPSPGLLARLG